MQVQVIVTNEQEFVDSWEDEIRPLIDGAKMMEIAIRGANVFANMWRIREIAHNKSGQYQQSISVVPGHSEEGLAEVSVETDLEPPYDFYLEYGTSQMGAIPIMRPAYDASKDRVLRVLEEGLAGARNE